ncbi:MAG: prolipoprotein diacylglyceryl transferase [Gemmatimonadota bacterium]|nr:MAG: prolipoprotein diacylglyceryl transferase [Gemmatimonadota bacterium]
MHRTLLDLGLFQVHSYGFFLAVSFALGIWLAGWRAEKRGIPAERITDVSLVIVLATVIGARALFVMAHWSDFADRPGDIFRTWEGGLTMYGGAIPATILGMWYLRRAGVDAWRAADAIAPSMALGLGFTRIGCFLSGCCFGKPTDLPWGCVFPAGSHAASVFPGQALHPAQLYASLAGFAICAFLLWIDRRDLRRGALFLMFLALYSVARTLLDLVRTYDATAFPIASIPITLNQWISVAVFAFAVGKLLRDGRRVPA